MNHIDKNAKSDIVAVIDLLDEALRLLRSGQQKRHRAIQHVDAAVKCLKDPRGHIHPSRLNSANDG